MMRRMFTLPATLNINRLIAVVLVGLIANMFVWAAHADSPAPPEGNDSNPGIELTLNIHKHQEGGTGEIVEQCDHCCHASSHLLSIKTVTPLVLDIPATVLPKTVHPFPADVPAAPPFIPPIA